MQKTWDEWYKIAKKYARNHKGMLASIKEDYVTSDGDKLGMWVQSQRFAYKNRNVPQEKRNRNYSILNDEQVIKLEELWMIWDVRENTFKVRNICIKYFTYEGFQKNKQILIHIPERILQAKINYCLKNDLPIMENNRLNHIFYVSSINLEVEYGIALEDLLKDVEDKKELKNVFS